ncbi:MAG: UDP-N-acetylmuramate dehydrogenase [Patescibacteria group bacterium]
MKILENYDLIKLNTFSVSACAKFFIEIENENEIVELFNSSQFKNNEKLFLGGGSNVLFTKNFDGIVILNKLKGIEILEVPTLEEVGIPIENVGKDFVFIKAESGENWHNLVLFSVSHNYWGIENLALIPGTVGAAPMQNIGAYGVELKDVLVNVEAINIETGERKIFENENCKFGYRDSVFKTIFKGQYFILNITLKLSKTEKKNISYGALKEHIEKNKIKINTPKDISDVVEEIRKSKLPDPKIIGNAGSFFKNVFVEESKFKELLAEYPSMPYFKDDETCESKAFAKTLVKENKIPAGWLIEQCGWKGCRIGNVGVHDKQALVLVNYGGATGEEIKKLANLIMDSVMSKFNLKLTPEVNLI